MKLAVQFCTAKKIIKKIYTPVLTSSRENKKKAMPTHSEWNTLCGAFSVFADSVM